LEPHEEAQVQPGDCRVQHGRCSGASPGIRAGAGASVPPMSERERDPETDGPDEDDELAPTPFDGPWVLPAVLLGLAIWFGYDGFLNPDPDMQRWWWFNQGGAAVFAVGAVFFGWRALRRSDPDGGS